MKPLTPVTSVFFLAASLVAQTEWRDLEVRDELTIADCKGESYRDNRGDYAYGQYVEDLIVSRLGGIWSPYTGEIFESTSETQIEHIVARAEAHRSGLCLADKRTRRGFASDLLNLTLADPRLNSEKSDHDAAEWPGPKVNRCWYAEAILAVKIKYDLSVDCREAKALEKRLQDDCGLRARNPRCEEG